MNHVEPEGHHEEDECHRSNSRGECGHEGTDCTRETQHKRTSLCIAVWSNTWIDWENECLKPHQTLSTCASHDHQSTL